MKQLSWLKDGQQGTFVKMWSRQGPYNTTTAMRRKTNEKGLTWDLLQNSSALA